MQRRRYKRQRMLAPLPETLQYDNNNNNNKNNNNKTKKHSAVPSVFYKTNKTRTKQKRGAIKIPYFIKYQEYNNNKKSERKSPGSYINIKRYTVSRQRARACTVCNLVHRDSNSAQIEFLQFGRNFYTVQYPGTVL